MNLAAICSVTACISSMDTLRPAGTSIGQCSRPSQAPALVVDNRYGNPLRTTSLLIAQDSPAAN